MSSKTTIWIVSMMLFSFGSFSQNWTQKASFPGSGRYGVQVFEINGMGYVGCTGGSGSSLYKDLYKYDPVSNTWSTMAPFSGSARRVGVGFSIGAYGYVGLGWTGSQHYKDFYKYDPSSNSWSQRTSYPGVAGRNSFGTSANGKGYVGGGSTGISTPFQTDWWEYNPSTNSWTQKASFPFGGRGGGICFSIGTIVYVGQGNNGSSSSKDLWAYDTQTDTWTQKANFPGIGRLHASSFVLNGKAIVGGGYQLGTGTMYSDYYSYDPATNSWTSVPGFSADKRAVSEGFTINGKGYVTAGWDDNNVDLNDLWMYSICSAKNLDITRIGNTLSSVMPGQKYQWIDCLSMTPIFGDTNQVYIPKMNGSYAVILDQGLCADTSECVEINWVGINEKNKIQASIYPNPTHDILFIDFGTEHVKVKIDLLTIHGQLVYQESFSGVDEIALMMPVPSGLYFLQIDSEKERSVYQVVKK